MEGSCSCDGGPAGAATLTRHQVVGEACERDAHEEEQDSGGDVWGEVEALRHEDPGTAQRLDRTDDADEGHVFLEADHVVHQGRHDAANGLWQHDAAHRLGRAETERSRCCALAFVDALDAGAEHLGHIGGVAHHQGDIIKSLIFMSLEDR